MQFEADFRIENSLLMSCWMSLFGKMNQGFDKAMPMNIWPFYASTRLNLFRQEKSSRGGIHAKRENRWLGQ